MTICKALKQKHGQQGFYHRHHKAKKNRTVVYGRDFIQDYKRKKEKLKYEENNVEV